MRALSLTLLCLGSVSFLGLEAAPTDPAWGFQRRWSKWWEQQQQQRRKRARRELLPSPALFTPEANLVASNNNEALVRPLDAKDLPSLPEKEEKVSLVRLKRSSSPSYYSSPSRLAALPAGSSSSLSLSSHVQHALRSGCRLGTCNTAHLAHRIFHLTDKDKDSTAPAAKLSPHGYGRRRRKRRRRR